MTVWLKLLCMSANRYQIVTLQEFKDITLGHNGRNIP